MARTVKGYVKLSKGEIGVVMAAVIDQITNHDQTEMGFALAGKARGVLRVILSGKTDLPRSAFDLPFLRNTKIRLNDRKDYCWSVPGMDRNDFNALRGAVNRVTFHDLLVDRGITLDQINAWKFTDEEPITLGQVDWNRKIIEKLSAIERHANTKKVARRRAGKKASRQDTEDTLREKPDTTRLDMMIKVFRLERENKALKTQIGQHVMTIDGLRDQVKEQETYQGAAIAEAQDTMRDNQNVRGMLNRQHQRRVAEMNAIKEEFREEREKARRYRDERDEARADLEKVKASKKPWTKPQVIEISLKLLKMQKATAGQIEYSH